MKLKKTNADIKKFSNGSAAGYCRINNCCSFLIKCHLNFIPVISIGEVGVRGSVTLLILGLFSDAEICILVAALFLWLLNIGLPALAGSLMLRKIKF